MNPFTIMAPPLGWLLALFYGIIPNYGVAIIVLTIAVNLVLFPLTLKQTRSMKAMTELQPEIKRLQKEFKADRQELNQELMALYKDRGVNPAAGCLPLLLQMPVWFALFSVLRTSTRVDEATGVLELTTGHIPEDSNLATAILEGNTRFLSMDLGVSPQFVFSMEGIVAALPYIVLVLIVGVTGWYQSRQTMARRSDVPTNDPKQQQQQQSMQLIGKIMGPMLGVFSWFWPTGLVVYFASSNIFRVGQQAMIFRLDEGGDDSGNGAKRSKGSPDGGDASAEPKRSGPHPTPVRRRRVRGGRLMDVYDVEVEAQAKTVDEAKALAVEKLGLTEDRVDFTVVQEGKGGFLGIGGQPAVITARAKPKVKRRKRRRGRRSSRERATADQGTTTTQKSRSGGANRNRESRSSAQPRSSGRPASGNGKWEGEVDAASEAASIDEQGAVAKEFLEGLLAAFGLEGSVVSEVEDDILIVRVDGDQTEALVGNRGAIMQSVLELTRTVIQRKTYGAPRMRIDIAGYGERRREALKSYAASLADKVLADGGEIMLEPMNPADRKVVHHAVSDIDGVRSLSEGEDPDRSVVISAE